MATSSKVKFNLETLKAKALESIDSRIKRATLEVESLDSQEAMDERVAQWRADQEKRVSDLFSRLGDGRMRDRELAEFRIAPMPETSIRDRSRAESRLRDLKDTRSQIVAKAESLVPDDEGNISLTKTQLDEFFGL